MPKEDNFNIKNTEQVYKTFVSFPEKVILWLIIKTLFLKRDRVFVF